MNQRNMMSSLFKGVVVLAAGLAASIGAANANVITIGGGTATITCTPDCEAIVGGNIDPAMLGSLSMTNADIYDVSPNNEATEAAALNALAGTSFSALDALKTQAGGVDVLAFDTGAAWVAVKIGLGHFFIHNIGDGIMSLNIAYLKADGPGGAGGGLSHYTEFGGDVPDVPIPGALWLMIAGIAGLGAAGRKKKAA